MTIVQRVQDILLRPKATWPEIEAEPASTASLYTGYLMILALIPAVAGFIGMSLVGLGMFGITVRVPILSGLVTLVLSYVVSLVMVFVVSLIVDALAPTFGGTKNPLNALKLVTYTATAGMLGGVFMLLPALSMLAALAGLYGIYLLYLGLPVLMKCPPEKAAGYTAVIAVCAIVAGLLVGGVSSLMTPSPAGMGSLGAALPGASGVSIQTPGGGISIDAAKLEAMGQRMAATGKAMEQAQASGNPAAAGQAAAAALAAMTGVQPGEPLPPQTLKAMLPERVGQLSRTSIEAQSGAAMGLGGSQARAVYREGQQNVELAIIDMGGLGLMSAAAWANVTLDREANGQVEKIYKDGKRTVREKYGPDQRRSEYSLVLANGVMVEAKGDHIDIQVVRDMVSSLPLGKLESMPRAPAKS